MDSNKRNFSSIDYDNLFDSNEINSSPRKKRIIICNGNNKITNKIYTPHLEWQEYLSDHHSITNKIFDLSITSWNIMSRMSARKLESLDENISNFESQPHDMERYNKIITGINPGVNQLIPFGIVCLQEVDYNFYFKIKDHYPLNKIKYTEDYTNSNRGGLLTLLTDINLIIVKDSVIATKWKDNEGINKFRNIGLITTIFYKNRYKRVLNIHLPLKYAKIDLEYVLNFIKEDDILVGDFNLNKKTVIDLIRIHEKFDQINFKLYGHNIDHIIIFFTKKNI